MATYHDLDLVNSPAFKALRQYVEDRRKKSPRTGAIAFEEHEKEIARLVSVVGSEILADDLQRLDVDSEQVTVEGVEYRKVLQCAQTYFGQLGPMRVIGHLYRPRGGGRTICPLELRAGIVEGAWTPRAARLMVLMVAEIPPSDVERLWGEIGGLAPSASSLDRLPKDLSARWEDNRTEWEDALRLQDTIPANAVTMAVSIDGVHAPMRKPKDAPKEESSYKEASCGTVTFLDKDAEPLKTIRYARMPEKKKETLKAELRAEHDWALEQRPDLRVAKVADGAADNWDFLGQLSSDGPDILDFYHAATHLKTSADAVHGAETVDSRALYESWKTTLKEEPTGADKVIRAILYRRDETKGKAKATLTRELKYFRTLRNGMDYQAYKAAGYPIGSGMVEAACKTLVSERLKQSGMRWTQRGGQAILTLRSVIQSGRFESAWKLLVGSYESKVQVQPDHALRATG